MKGFNVVQVDYCDQLENQLHGYILLHVCQCLYSNGFLSTFTEKFDSDTHKFKNILCYLSQCKNTRLND